MEKAALIQRIVEQYNKAKELQDMQDPTFLSVIGKAYHENYLSRLIAYALKKDEGFLRGLLGLSDKLGERTVECEKYMDGSRADIFVVIPGENITVTIENKTDTWEHDDQTQAYYNWVEKNYPDHANYFFYLCPNYNPSTPSCEAYKIITYADLADLIPGGTDDPIIRDLKKHSKEKLGVNNMGLQNYDIEVIKHYDELTQLLSDAKRNIAAYQNAAIEEIKEKLTERYQYRFPMGDEWKEEKNDGKELLLIQTDLKRGIISSYRLYKPEWKKDDYYFYVEILFQYKENYGDIRGIRYQRTLCAPSKEDAENIKNSGQIDFETPESENEYIVLEKSEQYDFSDPDVWDNPDENWKDQFVKEATEILPRLLKKQSKAFEEIKGKDILNGK